MKLVELPEPTFLERFAIPEGKLRREQYYAKKAFAIRNALDVLDHEEMESYMAQEDLSRQDIMEMCKALSSQIASITYSNTTAIRYLHALEPLRIWTGEVHDVKDGQDSQSHGGI